MARFTIRGNSYEIGKEDIRQAVEGKAPGPIRTYYLEVNSKKYPIKQVLALVTGLPPISFTSVDAYRILDKLGYKIDLQMEP